MSTEIGGTGHLTDGDVVRYVDGEGSAAERAGWERHVAGCDRCAGEVGGLRSDDRLIRSWLERAAFEAGGAGSVAVVGATGDRRPGARAVAGAPRRRPAEPRVRPWLQAAAVLVLLAGALATVPPVRAWVLDRVAPLLTSDPAPAGTAAPATVDPQVVRFVPDAGPFVLTLDDPANATLRLGRASGAEAVLRAESRSEPVVSATGVRVAGTGGGGEYELSLPPQTTGVRLRLGGRELRLDGAQLDRGLVLSMDGEGQPRR